MEIKDISPSEISGNTWNTSDNEFKEIGREKVLALEKTIREIKEQIKTREELSSGLIRDAEKIKIEINNFLLENKGVIGSDVNINTLNVAERTALRRKKVEISELELNEKVKCWQDIALLKKELREAERELTERKSRLNMFDKILE